MEIVCSLIVIGLAIINCTLTLVDKETDVKYYKIQYLFASIIIITEALQILGYKMGW